MKLRSPSSAGLIACCGGVGEHSLPLASRVIAVINSRILSALVKRIQPARQPGIKCVFDKLSNVITGAPADEVSTEAEVGGVAKHNSRYTSSEITTTLCSAANARICLVVSSEVIDPVGLLGLMTTIARVRSLIKEAISSIDGCQLFRSFRL